MWLYQEASALLNAVLLFLPKADLWRPWDNAGERAGYIPEEDVYILSRQKKGSMEY